MILSVAVTFTLCDWTNFVVSSGVITISGFVKSFTIILLVFVLSFPNLSATLYVILYSPGIDNNSPSIIISLFSIVPSILSVTLTPVNKSYPNASLLSNSTVSGFNTISGPVLSILYVLLTVFVCPLLSVAVTFIS